MRRDGEVVGGEVEAVEEGEEGVAVGEGEAGEAVEADEVDRFEQKYNPVVFLFLTRSHCMTMLYVIQATGPPDSSLTLSSPL